MVDSRLHLFTLVAVFLALGTGILLGGALTGDGTLFREKQHALIAELEGRFDAMRRRERSLADRVAVLEKRVQQDESFASGAVPWLVAGRLEGLRVAILTTRTDGYAAAVSAAVQAAGARPFTLPLAGPAAPETGARAVAAAAAPAGGPDAAVVLFHPGDRLPAIEPALREAVRLFRAGGVRVVAGEARATEPSLVPLFRRLELSSVDNADEAAGRVALVFLLAGAEGHYGVKGTAAALLPALAGSAGAP